jgi:pimeloyl-ACP methyl ester carboxylesterase
MSAMVSPPLFSGPSDGQPVLMVHGAFCGGWCFDGFRTPFEAAGYQVAAPDLPGRGRAGESAAGLSMRDYARAVVEWVEACPSPPILIGHSMGGLAVQLAAARVSVKALVLLAPSPPWGQPVMSLGEAAAAVALYHHGAYWLEAIAPDYPTARAMTFNRLPEAESRRLFAKMVPESGRALFEIVNWWLDPTASTLVPPASVRVPVLAIAGGEDQVNTPASVEAAAARVGGEMHVVPTLSHWTIGEPGSERVAEAALAWLGKL